MIDYVVTILVQQAESEEDATLLHYAGYCVGLVVADLPDVVGRHFENFVVSRQYGAETILVRATLSAWFTSREGLKGIGGKVEFHLSSTSVQKGACSTDTKELLKSQFLEKLLELLTELKKMKRRNAFVNEQLRAARAALQMK